MIALFTANLWRAAAIAAIAAGLWQTNRIEGWVILNGLEQDVADCQRAKTNETKAHQDTKNGYRSAQVIAELEQAVKVAGIEAEQERITQNVASNFRSRIAELDERVRELARTRAGSARAAGGGGVPVFSDASLGTEAASGDLAFDERVICIRQAIQLDELINWNEEQAGSDRFSDIPVTGE